MSTKSDALPVIDESLFDEAAETEETGALETEQRDFDFMEAAEELQQLSERLFKRADKVNSPSLASALEAKGDKLTTESLKMQGYAAEQPANLAIESVERQLISLRAEAQDLLKEKDAKPSSAEIMNQPDPSKTWTFQELNNWRSELDYEPLLRRAQETLEPSTEIEPLGDSYYISAYEDLEAAAGKICPFCKKKITRKDIEECRGEGNEGLLLRYGASYYHSECWLMDLLIHAAGDCIKAAQLFHVETYLGELRAFKMSWKINYGAFGATSPRANIPVPDPEATAAAAQRRA